MTLSMLSGHTGYGRIGRFFVSACAVSLFTVLFWAFFVTPHAYAAPDPNVTPRWVSDTEIKVGDLSFTRTSTTPWVFTYSVKWSTGGTGNIQSSCNSTLTFSSDPYAANGGLQANAAYKEVAARNPDGTFTSVQQCVAVEDVPSTVSIANASAVNANKSDGSVDEGVGDDQADESTETAFDNEHCSGGRLAWIVCPVVYSIFEGLDHLEGLINQVLTVNVDEIYGPSKASADGYYKAWGSFRNIAYGLVFIAALIIIIASALGLEILDAYTIRKTIPRVIIAVIFIAVSWQVTEFLVTLSNDVGNGMRAIIYAPFSNSGFEAVQLNTGEQFLGTALVAGAGSVLGLFALLSFAITGFLAFALAFLVLVLRELIIVVLVIISPLAIAAMILPNTQKAWKLWQNTLQAMLIAFPIIALLLAVGRVFASITFQASLADEGTAKGSLLAVIAFAALIIPYFMLPYSFRLAGGFMAQLGGVFNDRSRGAFDRLSKYRQGKSAQNLHAMKVGNRWQEGGKVQGALGINRAKRGLNFATSEGSIMALSSGKRDQKRDIRRRMEAENIMKDPRFSAIKEDDNATRAMTYRSTAEARDGVYEHLMAKQSIQGRSAAEYGSAEAFEAAARQESERAANAVTSSIGFGRAQAVLGAQQLATTGTGFRNLDDEAEVISRVSNGNTSTAAQIAGYNNFVSKQKGRFDLAPGAGNLIQLAHGKIAQRRQGIPTTDESAAQMQNAWNSGNLYMMGTGKSAGMQNFVDHHVRMMRSANADNREQAAIAFMEMQSMLPGASGENQVIIRKAMEEVGIDYSSQMSLDEQIARRAYAGTANNALAFGDLPPDGSPETLRRRARVYDREAELAQRNAG